MIYSNYAIEPPREVLDHCAEVLIGDPGVRIRTMKKWCWDNDLSLIWCDCVETADVSALYDSVAAFYFYLEADATLFRLKWK